MGHYSSIGLDNLRANWTPSQDQYFLELLLSHVHKGNRNGKAFSKQAWAEMIEQFNTTFGFKYEVDVLKNRHKRFRKQYNEIKMLLSQKGFQWDKTLNMVMADDKTWDDYIKAHPDVQGYKTRVVPYYDELCIIFGHAVADGRYSLSCFDVDFECEEIAAKELDDQTSTTSKGLKDQTPPTAINKSKIDWSSIMDQFFVELMLDQLRKGNKIGHTFKKKAWADMIELFNERFGCHYHKVVLKNRLIVLRKHYRSIRVLLGKDGFSWDNTQQKVVADDQVWEKCIRVHHNFRLYRIKSMPFFPNMCIICHNELTAEWKSNLGKGFSEANNSAPDTKPLPDADNGALHVGGENSSTIATQPLANSDKEGLLLGGGKNVSGNSTPDAQPQPVPNADKGAMLESGGKNSTRATQLLPNVDKGALLLGAGKNVSGHQKRHQPNLPQTLKESKKAKKYNEGMTVALKHVAAAVTSLTKKRKKEDNFSVDNVITVLQAIPDLDDDLILDACDFLEDERRARMFLALDANLRKKWLLRKLRSE